MNLEEAVKLIKDCFEKMNSLYGKVVFDEWVLVSFAETKEKVLAYSGPRREHFKKNFDMDVKTFRSQLLAVKHHIGDFDFARHATGTHFDAFVMVGKNLFLICNSTNQSMHVIAKDPKWLNAQIPFAAMTHKFGSDAMVEA